MEKDRIIEAAGAGDRVPDSIIEIRKGNKVLIVKGFYCKDTKATAADRMIRSLKAEAIAEDLFSKIA